MAETPCKNCCPNLSISPFPSVEKFLIFIFFSLFARKQVAFSWIPASFVPFQLPVALFSGLVVNLGSWLDLIVLEIFSSLSDS